MTKRAKEVVQLHDDMWMEILARLPVKSLIRFTCVCKLWLSLIKSPEFASRHYAARLSRKDDNEYDSFLTSFFPACSISIFCYETMAFETAFKIRPAVAAYEPPRFDISHRDIITNCFISGPCNGLFLLKLCKGLYYSKTVLLLWNPATREVFNIPFPNENVGYDSYVVGLGFDHVAYDYKVVFFNGHDAKSSLVSLYSLAANYWRQVDAGLYIDVSKKTIQGEASSLSLSSNGCKTHYLSRETTDGFYFGLASFDMVDEVFVETALPHELATSRKVNFGGFWRQSSHNEVYPTVYGISFTNLDTLEVHIWALKEGYGPAGVWNKQQSIVSSDLGCGQLMLWYDTDIVDANEIYGISVHNLATLEKKTLQLPGDGQHIIPYVESLISIAGFIRHQPPPSVEFLHSPVELKIARQGYHYQEDDHSWVELDPAELQSLLDRFSEIPERKAEDHKYSDSSTDSAFLMPRGKYVREYGDIYNNYEADTIFHPYRENECKRLCRLPYCLREVSQPLSSNPCTF